MSKEEIETLAELKYPINIAILHFEVNEQFAKRGAFVEGYLLGHTTALDEAAERAIAIRGEHIGYHIAEPVVNKESITDLKIKE